ncbi:MAG: hypothetical protein ACT4P4_13380 [Betaproteobacteria bacterium]
MRSLTSMLRFGVAQRLRAGYREPSGPLRSLDPGNIATAPDKAGVYFIYSGRRLVFIGLAPRGASIRRDLERHLAPGREGLAFKCLATHDPVPVYRNSMVRYVEAHDGALPPWNLAALQRRPS